MFKCKYCEKEFDTKQQLGGHIIWCKENPNRNGHSGFEEYNEKRKQGISINEITEDEYGHKTIMRYCDKHGYTEFVLRRDGIYRCRKCAADYVQKRRKEIKKILVDYKGGKCERCEYDECIAALEFHHINPDEKDFGISASGVTRSLEILKKEVDKCVLLCCNCHRKLHWLLDCGVPVDLETFLKK